MTYFWDFYGPNARGIAEHFARHLGDFMARYQLTAFTAGAEALAPNHWAAWCKSDDLAVQDAVKKALRPQRQES